MRDWLIALGQAVGLFVLVLWSIAAMVHGAHGQQKCSVNEFYRIGWTEHDPTERHREMIRWLEHIGPGCSKDELVVIWNNLAEWAGTADSAQLRHRVIELYERLPKK